MYILDTDHLSVFDRGGAKAQQLRQRLVNVSATQVAVSVISYEEQTRGWLSYIAKAQTLDQQVEAYKQLKRQLDNYCGVPMVEFDERAAQEFERQRKTYPRLGTMDLKIAAIARVNQAVLLTRNLSDFGQVIPIIHADISAPQRMKGGMVWGVGYERHFQSNSLNSGYKSS